MYMLYFSKKKTELVVNVFTIGTGQICIKVLFHKKKSRDWNKKKKSDRQMVKVRVKMSVEKKEKTVIKMQKRSKI